MMHTSKEHLKDKGGGGGICCRNTM